MHSKEKKIPGLGGAHKGNSLKNSFSLSCSTTLTKILTLYITLMNPERPNYFVSDIVTYYPL